MNAFNRIRATTRSRTICKDPANGIIFGVSAGIGWWLGVKVWFVRALTIIALLLWTGPVLVAYAVAALLLDRRPLDRVSRFDDQFSRYHRHWGGV